MKRISSVLACAGVLLLGGVAAADDAPDPCSQFAWNVTHELALFSGASLPATAGKDAASAPAIEPERLYELQLSPQSEVAFAHAPSKKALNDGAYAGLARVHISRPGVYRVAINGPFWIDVIAAGKVLVSGDFTGNHACKSVSKLVEFQLSAGDVLLQLSGAGQAHVRVALTPSPPKTTS
jgi:hypothetical protein